MEKSGLMIAVLTDLDADTGIYLTDIAWRWSDGVLFGTITVMQMDTERASVQKR